MSDPRTTPLPTLPPDQLALAMQHAATAYGRGAWGEAEQWCRRILAVRGDYFDALNLLGIIAAQTRRTEEAAAWLRRAVAANPGDATAHTNHGNVLRELNRLEEALDSHARAVQIKPDYVIAYNNRGNTLQELKRFEDALASYTRALQIKPDYAEAHNNRGVTLQALRRFDEALESYAHALKIRPDYAEAYYNRGNALQEVKRFDEALESFERALAIRSNDAQTYNNRGNALQKLGRFDEALESYECALKLNPGHAEAHNNRANTLQELKRFEEALESFARALQTKPDYAEAYNNRGVTLQELRRFEEALESYERALQFNPGHVEARVNRGNTLQELKRFDYALASYERALHIKPDYEWLYGTWLHTKRQLCDWSRWGSEVATLRALLEQARHAAPPFPVLALIDSLSLQRRAAETWSNENHPGNHLLPRIAKRHRREKLRIGYYSADYHDHPVAHLIAGLLELHDRERFELVAFSHGPDARDEMRKRLSAAFDHFLDVRTKSDVEVARMSRELEIDIAVDLSGFTQGGRTGIFSCRAAPIQVNYLGYPGTMSARYMDYIIADATLIPEESRQHYSEKIAYLPNSFQVTDRKRDLAAKEVPRAKLGLPTTGFVFCCFNNTYKISPGTFNGWMRILQQVEDSVLWLAGTHETAADNLRREAEARGVRAERLLFARRVALLPEHLACYRTADLFLDTLPYNAHATASDALWSGLPVLTQIGESYAARVAASLLHAVDLPELITTTQEHYETMAIALARDPARLAQLKGKLDQNRLVTPLFDTELFTKHLEEAYRQMYERYQTDVGPEHIYVAP